MASVVGDIAIQIGADISPLVRDLGRAQGQVTAFGASASGAASGGMRAFSLAGAAMAGAAITAGLGLVALTKNSLESIDAISKASDKLGIHTAALQDMAQVANEAGIETGALTSALVKMQNNIAGLMEGTTAQTQAFAKLGLSVADLAGKGADEQFAIIAKAIDAIGDPTLRTAAAMDVFGKSGADLIPMFEGFGAAVANANAYLEQTNQHVTDLGGKNVEAANDAIGRMSQAFSGLGNTLAVGLAPLLESTAIGLEDLISKMMHLGDVTDSMVLDALMDQVAVATAGAVNQATLLAATVSDPKIAGALQANIISIQASDNAFKSGAISAEEYKKQIGAAIANIEQLIIQAGEADNLDMSDSIDQMINYGLAIMSAVNAYVKLSEVQGTGSGTAGAGAGASGIGSITLDSGSSGGSKHSGGGGGAADDLASKIKLLEDGFKTTEQIEMAAYERDQAMLDDALARKLLSLEQYHADSAALAQQHQEALAAIDGATYGTGLQQAEGYFGVLSDTFQNGNDNMLKLAREFGAAEALINAWRAASQTLADPTLPFFAKFAAVAAVLGAGLSMVQSIKSGGSSGSAGGSAPPTSSGGGGGSSSSGGSTQAPLQVAFTGIDPSSLYSGSQISSIFDMLTKEAGDRGLIMVQSA